MCCLLKRHCASRASLTVYTQLEPHKANCQSKGTSCSHGGVSISSPVKSRHHNGVTNLCCCQCLASKQVVGHIMLVTKSPPQHAIKRSTTAANIFTNDSGCTAKQPNCIRYQVQLWKLDFTAAVAHVRPVRAPSDYQKELLCL